MPRTDHVMKGQAAIGGTVAGILGGTLITALVIVTGLARSADAMWRGLKLAGLPFMHDRALEPGFDLNAVIVGVATHFAVSIAWGLLFALAVYGIGKGATVLAGAVWGVVVWLVMFHIVLPAIGLGDMARAAPVRSAVFEHVLFGLTLGIGFLPFQHTRGRRAPIGRVRVAH